MAGENPAVELQQSVFPLRSNNRQRWKQTVRIVSRQAAPERQDSPASMPGTESLSGEGDFLYCKGKRTKRIQGPMVASEEYRKIADYLRTHN